MVSITMYGGVGEIGGNKTLIEDGKARIFLDMGQSFGFGEEFFAGYLMARTGRVGLRDFFELDLMPKIPGLYSKDMLDRTGFKYRKPMFDGIFLSHIHFDHCQQIAFAHPDIPVHLGEGTKIIKDSWESTSNMKFGEHDYQTFRTGDRIDVNGIEVEPIHVDHSVPAAYGYIVHTKKGAVVYTGDFRQHGSHKKLTEDFLDRVKEERPIALICEGTRVAPEEKRKNYTEAQVKSHSKQIVKKAGKKLVVTTFYPRDVDRIRTFYEVAKATGRKFVVSARTAHLLQSLGKDTGIKLPNVMKNKHILVFHRELARAPPLWERDFEKKWIGSDEVHRRQGELILQLDFWHFNEFVDIKPKKGSEFIHSKSEPFEENDIEDEVKHNWLKRFGLHHHQYHASGHCSMSEIKSIIADIDPKVVIPIHTEYPNLFKRMAEKVKLPVKGKKFTI